MPREKDTITTEEVTRLATVPNSTPLAQTVAAGGGPASTSVDVPSALAPTDVSHASRKGRQQSQVHSDALRQPDDAADAGVRVLIFPDVLEAVERRLPGAVAGR